MPDGIPKSNSVLIRPPVCPPKTKGKRTPTVHTFNNQDIVKCCGLKFESA